MIVDDYNLVPLYAMPILMLGKAGALVRTSAQGGHADELETALMLHLKRDFVAMTKALADPLAYRSRFVAGDMYPDHETVKGVYWSTFHIQKTKSGAQGDATAATQEKGAKFLDLIVANFSELLTEYCHFGNMPAQ